jgi:hypothetical protein
VPKVSNSVLESIALDPREAAAPVGDLGLANLSFDVPRTAVVIEI